MDAESDLVAPTKSWVERQFSAGLPAGTRTLRLKLRGERGEGTNNDAYFDAVTADLLLHGGGAGSLPPVLATWRFQVPSSEAYEVYAKWPESAGHASDAGYRVFHAAGASTAVVRSQRQGGGLWTRLGSFGFEAGREHWVELTDQDDGGVVADAIYVVKAARSYDSYSWAPGLPSAGDYAVYAKWAADAGRAA